MTRLALLCAVAVLAMSPFAPAAAQSGGMKGMDMKDHKGMDMKVEKKGDVKEHRATGVVKSVDKAKGTVTIDHGPVASMKWPAMTMGFKAKDKKALDGLKPGQKIEFEFVQRGKDSVITQVK